MEKDKIVILKNDSKLKNLKDLGDLKIVNGDLILENCSNLKSLKNLEIVAWNLVLEDCSNLKDLGNLKRVGKKLYLKGLGITPEYIRKEKPKLLKKCIWHKSYWKD